MSYRKLTKKQYKNRQRILAWLEGKVALECEMGQLPGKFEMSNITVHGYILRRSAVAMLQSVESVGGY